MPEVIQTYRTDAEVLRNNSKLDSDTTAFFARQLEFVKAETFDVRYAELKARSLIPVSNDGGPGVNSITYYQYDMFGAATIIGTYATDLPRADIRGKRFEAPVHTVADAYGYAIEDIEAARYAGLPLEQRKANAALRAIEQKVNTIAWFGDADHGLPGFFANPNVPVAAVADTGNNGGAAATQWVYKTPDQILYDLNQCAAQVLNNTQGVEQPDTLLLPLKQYNYIAGTPRSAVSDTTILDYFLKNNPYIKNVVWLNELAGAGTGVADMMVAYSRNPDKIEMRIPVAFQQLPVQEEGLEFIIPCRLRTGGVVMMYPLSANFAYGI